MKHYIIDTLNVINKSNFIKSKTKKDKTTAIALLIELIKTFNEKYRTYSFTLVCDGKVDEPLNINQNIKLIAAKDESADDVVKKLIKKTNPKSNLIVVSSDLEVYAYAKANLCEVMQSEKFLQLLQKDEKTIKTKIPSSKMEKPISASKKEIAEFKKLFGAEENE
jgi:predicted RNA-binding protein with PIN domain